jgi:hypothetical protein
MSELRHQLTQAAAESASAPAVKATALGAGITSIGDWLTTGPGIATGVGLLLTLASLSLQTWSVIRRDRREQREHDARMRNADVTEAP